MDPKRLVPPIFRARLRRLVHAARAVRISFVDYRRFHGHAAPAGAPATVANEQALLLYYAHSIEKGLSRSNFRPGFGEAPLGHLASLINRWVQESRDPDDPHFVTACATVRAYFDRHRELGVDVHERLSLFTPLAQGAITIAAGEGGVRTYMRPETTPTDFGIIANTRVSMREFAEGDVAQEDIDRAISIAMRAPSACNRQSSRAHVIRDPKLIDDLLRIQAGLGGYPRPPVLVLVTSDASFFVEATERNQPYVDGGLFAMSLIFALEYMGLATCALTSMMWPRNEQRVRDLLGLENSECFVTFIATGHRPEVANVPYSRRTPLATVRKIH